MYKKNIFKFLVGIFTFSLGYALFKNPLNSLIIQYASVFLMALGLFVVFKTLFGKWMKVNKKKFNKQELYDHKQNRDPVTNLIRNLDRIIIFGAFFAFLFIPQVNEYLINGKTSILFWMIGIGPIIAGLVKMITGKGLDVLPHWLKGKSAALDGFVEVLVGIGILVYLATRKLIP